MFTQPIIIFSILVSFESKNSKLVFGIIVSILERNPSPRYMQLWLSTPLAPADQSNLQAHLIPFVKHTKHYPNSFVPALMENKKNELADDTTTNFD